MQIIWYQNEIHFHFLRDNFGTHGKEQRNPTSNASKGFAQARLERNKQDRSSSNKYTSQVNMQNDNVKVVPCEIDNILKWLHVDMITFIVIK